MEKVYVKKRLSREARLEIKVTREEAYLNSEMALRRKKTFDDKALLAEATWGSKNDDYCPRLTALGQTAWQLKPGLLTPPYREGLINLSMVAHDNNPCDWEPAGRGLSSAFSSLVAHLLGGYPANPHLVNSLLVNHGHWKNAARMAGLVQTVVSGGRVSRLVGTKDLPAPLTRQMCHILINPAASLGMVQAVRRAQVLGLGGSPALAKAIGSSNLGEFKSARNEIFWAEVIHWFCRQKDLRVSQVGPLCDYVAHRLEMDGDFRMKGRTLAALVRGMNQWHRELADLRKLGKAKDFEASGLAQSRWLKKGTVGGKVVVTETWALREIKGPKQLVTEGSAMHHCVASYHDLIRSGKSSIWTLTMNDSRRLTIEVRNRLKTVIQVRGRHNRLPKPGEIPFIQAWALKNGLVIQATGM